MENRGSGEILIKAEGVSKKFCKSLKRSLWYGMKDIGFELIGRDRNRTLRKEEFWAVKDVSFELRRGECLGLIGHNGAGKSTLLKILNGLIKPDTGRIEMRGKVGALIELGAGFNPILTGRENVFINAAVLGFDKKEIEEKFDEIVEFAELEEFIDTPVQNYSSGMKVRLGFAVAAQLEPDILIIDEVLAVGDIGFRLKCLNLLDRLIANCSVIFVSHQMPQVSRLSNQLMLLDHGKVVYTGSNVPSGIDQYYSMMSTKGLEFINTEGGVELLQIGIQNAQLTQGTLSVNHGDDLVVEIRLKISNQYANPKIHLIVFDLEQRPIGLIWPKEDIPNDRITRIDSEFSEIHLNLKTDHINLSKGIYSLTLSVTNDGERVLRISSVLTFQILSDRDIWQPIEFESYWS